jgi:hypothetical protein
MKREQSPQSSDFRQQTERIGRQVGRACIRQTAFSSLEGFGDSFRPILNPDLAVESSRQAATHAKGRTTAGECGSRKRAIGGGATGSPWRAWHLGERFHLGCGHQPAREGAAEPLRQESNGTAEPKSYSGNAGATGDAVTERQGERRPHPRWPQARSAREISRIRSAVRVCRRGGIDS